MCRKKDCTVGMAAEESMLSALWEAVYCLFRGNEFLMLTQGSYFSLATRGCSSNADVLPELAGSVAFTAIVFLLVNIPYTVLDLTGFPASLLKYKIQDEKAVPVMTTVD